MILRWLKRRRDSRAKAEADGQALLREFGSDGALDEVRRRIFRARDKPTEGERWWRARAWLRQQGYGYGPVGTATNMIESAEAQAKAEGRAEGQEAQTRPRNHGDC